MSCVELVWLPLPPSPSSVVICWWFLCWWVSSSSRYPGVHSFHLPLPAPNETHPLKGSNSSAASETCSLFPDSNSPWPSPIFHSLVSAHHPSLFVFSEKLRQCAWFSSHTDVPCPFTEPIPGDLQYDNPRGLLFHLLNLRKPLIFFGNSGLPQCPQLDRKVTFFLYWM